LAPSGRVKPDFSSWPLSSASAVSPAGHYGYAATWFSLAVVALVIYGLALAKRRRRETP